MITSFYIYLIKVTFCTILFYAFYHFVLKKENFFQLNRLYIIGSVILSLLIPYLQVPVETSSESAVDIYLGFDEYVVSEVSSAIGIQEASVWGVDKIILTIYSIGVIFLLIKMIISLFYVLHLRMWNRIEKRKGYNLVHISQTHPVFSFMNMIFWSDSLDYSEEEANQILLHELVHINQKHSLDVLFFEILNILLWFNPIIYLYKQSLKNTHEFIADYHLYKEQSFEIKYVDLLMKEAKTQRANSLPVVHTFFNNQLKKRLIMISNTNKRSSKFKLLACLPLVAMLIFMISCNKEILTNASTDYDHGSMAKATPGTIYQACEIDENGMITMKNGEKVTVDEMKEIIVERRKAEGDIITTDQVFIITKEEMDRNLQVPENDNLPELGETRLWITKDGKVNIMEDLGSRKFGPSLPIQSFNISMQKSVGEKNGELDYVTISMKLIGNKLNRTAIEFIESIPKSEIENSKMIFTNIIVTKDDKEYIKKEPTEISLDLWK